LLLHKGGARLFAFREKAGFPLLNLISPATLLGHFPHDPVMRYLECENQGYPDLHQVGFNIFIGKIEKILLLKGPWSVIPHFWELFA